MTMINYNMRCIETFLFNYNIFLAVLINYNMRCIETVPSEPEELLGSR